MTAQRPRERLVVAALGGNALLQRGEAPSVAVQLGRARSAAQALAPVAEVDDLVVTHGNGPQVGLLALQGDAAGDDAPVSLDALGAQTQGLIGHILQTALGQALPDRQVATLLTSVVVEADDPAFTAPTKPIGPSYDRRTADRLAHQRGWTVARDGQAWRRVVPSPEPRQVVQLPAIRLLLDADVIVICAGGGGVPVVAGPDGGRAGVEAVIDKDLTSALLATALSADVLLLLTDVDGVLLDRGTPRERLLSRTTPPELRSLALPPGSMGPKAEAAARFVEATGGRAVIGRLDQVVEMLEGRTGTQVDDRSSGRRS